MQKTSFTIALTRTQAAQLEQLLGNGSYRTFPVPYTTIAAELPDCKIMLYTSGKCVVQGKGAADWITFTLEPEILMEARLGYEEVLKPEMIQPHMGVDESGKGDFFGPMVIAAAYVDPRIAPRFKELDVRDSKTITSDRKAEEMAEEIKKVLDGRFALVKIGPAAYNRLYAKMTNVNSILAWGHARAIENLLNVVPDCPRAISDQFGPTRQIERALLQKGRKIELIQRPKAESDPAVAAASILARAAFIQSLREIQKRHGITIPKGASDKVREAAVELVKRHGPGVLLENCKCHFRTTDQVLAAAGHQRSELGPDGQAVSKARLQDKG